METKKYLTAITGENKALLNFLSKDNLMSLSILNIKIDGENVEFDTVSDFHKLESHKLDKGGQFAYELFNTFKNPRNAVASILLHLENKKPITEETFKNQSKNTPKNYTDDHRKQKSFGAFWEALSDKEKSNFSKIATAYYNEQGMEQSGFEFFFINGTNGKTLKSGDYVKLHDPVYGNKFLSRVAQASPDGFVTLVDDGGLLTLSAESAQKMQIVDEKTLSKEAKEFFTTAYEQFKKDGETDRISMLEKGAKSYFAKIEADNLAEEKAEKARKKLETSTATKAELSEIPLKTEADVKAFVKKLNTNSVNLTPDHKKELAKKVEDVRAKLAKKVSEAKKTTETPATDKPARPKRKSGTIATAPEANTPEAPEAKTEAPEQNQMQQETAAAN